MTFELDRRTLLGSGFGVAAAGIVGFAHAEEAPVSNLDIFAGFHTPENDPDFGVVKTTGTAPSLPDEIALAGRLMQRAPVAAEGQRIDTLRVARYFEAITAKNEDGHP
ncbi:MAG: hypothetical protein JWQ27_3370, partial [Ferruginibacter sp.]|nr:hypothetical protein [Ferruginibacter sp.]